MRTLDRTRLEPEDQELLRAAEGASQTATATYSDYSVGAALRVVTPNGEERIVTGNNYETINYNSVCAEKHALMRAYAEHSARRDGALVRPRVIAVAVHCATGGEPQQPCGDCRQALAEVNPTMRVISGAGPRPSEPHMHDPRVTLSGLGELLPYGFQLVPEAEEGRKPRLVDPDDIEDYVVHLPRPDALKADKEERLALLEGVGYLLLVGSPARARRVVQLAHDELGSETDAASGCYCDLSVPGRDELSREFVLYVARFPGGPNIAVASHGIGESGVEIVLSEVPALMEWVTGVPPDLRGVIRSGTRGTLSRVPLGCVAISTQTVNAHMDTIDADPAWVARLAQAARGLGMAVVDEPDVDDVGDDEDGTRYAFLGKGLSSRFFWQGQARPLYVPGRPEQSAAVQRQRLQMMQRWVRQGVRWIEMEDYAVHRISHACGYPSASLGAVIAHRRSAAGDYQVDYDKAAYKVSEMLPVQVALKAMLADHRDASG